MINEKIDNGRFVQKYFLNFFRKGIDFSKYLCYTTIKAKDCRRKNKLFYAKIKEINKNYGIYWEITWEYDYLKY